MIIKGVHLLLAPVSNSKMMAIVSQNKTDGASEPE